MTLYKNIQIRGLRFIIFTFRNYFTKSSSAADCSQNQLISAANIRNRRLVRPAGDDDFVIR